MQNLKPTPVNYDIAIIMNNHRKRIEELKQKKSQTKINETIAYRELVLDNPKRNYLLETKYTEI